MISPVKIWRHQKEITSYLGKEGVVISWTLIRVPPGGYEREAPYAVVLVELSDKRRIVAQLVDWKEENLRIGQEVRAVYRRIRQPDAEGVIPYGIKFTPF